MKLHLARLRDRIPDLTDNGSKILGLNDLASPRDREELNGVNAGPFVAFLPNTLEEKSKDGMPNALPAAATNLCLTFSVVATLGAAALTTALGCGP